MEIRFVSGCAYEDNEGDVLDLRVHLEKGEHLSLNEKIDIEMMDGSIIQRDIKLINPKVAGDFCVVSKKMQAEVDSGKTRCSKKFTEHIEGECYCDIIVLDVPYHEVKTEQEISERIMRAEMKRRVCITPYIQLHTGTENIYDHTDKGYYVSNKVIAYLQSGEAYVMCPGIYKHPFKENKELPGPYMYSDGHFYWDRDTWKYVLKYGLVLPQEFIDHVMSEKGTEYLESHSGNGWSSIIKEWKNKPNTLCLLPDNAGDISLDDF